MSSAGAIARTRLGMRSRRRRDSSWNWIDRTCVGIMIALLLMAVFAPLIAPYDPAAVNAAAVNVGPSSDYLLGTDSVGRDLLSRLIVGSRTSLVGPTIVAILSVAAGLIVGMVAGWRGGKVDQVLSAVTNVAFAFPGLLLAILSVAVFGRGLAAPIVALSIAYTPYVVRVARAAVLRERSLPYVEALRATGFSSFSICARHVLPSMSALLIAQGTLAFGYAMVDLAAISYLGLGVQPPTADWGAMVASGQTAILNGDPAQSLLAGGLIIITVTAVTVFGERLAGRAEARV